MLKSSFTNQLIEAGCDEAGRGCLAGPVFAAAVILPLDYINPQLNDSKKLTSAQRDKLRSVIESDAVAWAVEMVDNVEIDQINILNASILAMHKSLAKLSPVPELILVDGNRFKPFREISYQCIIKGDGLFLSIAAASVLAKTHRDEYMIELHKTFPQYGWDRNKGYPTLEHRKTILSIGSTPFHRETFTVQIKDDK
ncbi:MAG: ribonuclease HII [Bacteroidales bacterium]|nr:ribonuclease HII [Bacteroidales bacterium]